MKIKKIISLSIMITTMAISTAFAAPEPQKIAVVNIQKVVLASAQVKAINAERENKAKELQAFIKKAQADVDKQTDVAKKKSLAEKYEKELKAKREANFKAYNAKFKAADESIAKQISQKATEMGYTMVLPKAMVIYGGDDITDAIIKVIK